MVPASARPFQVIGELMNNSFARARTAWEARDPAAYRKLARLQTDLGVDYMTLFLDGTRELRVKPGEMVAFLPDLVPALQAETPVPISFDNPDAAFHRAALKAYDFKRSPAPILNSVSASRAGLDELLELANAYDTLVIVMASEKPRELGGGMCRTAADIHATARHFVELLARRAGRTNDRIIVDPGLPPMASDWGGGILTGLAAMRLIRADADLAGVHLMVGLTNVSQGTPKPVRAALERAYATVAVEAGLDFVLGNPEKALGVAGAADPTLKTVRDALAAGALAAGETWEDAGARQTETLMALYR